MSLSIGKNIASMHALRRLGNATDLIGDTRQRLASGSRINRAGDDAAGLAVASSLKAETRIGTQAIRNVNDGISMLNVAPGALMQLEELTTRRRELAEQAANGSYSSQQRQALERENLALSNEMYRIIGSTEYNGITLFDGSLASGVRIQAGTGIDGSIAFSLGASINSTATGTFSSTTTTFSAGRAVDVQIADFNKDGKLDFMSTYLGDEGGAIGTVVSVELGNGDGTFSSPSFFGVNQAPIYSSVNDFNGDGNLDIAVTNRSYFGGYLQGTTTSVILGNGNGTFKAPTSFTTGTGPSGIISGDFTGDGIVDLVVSDLGSLNGTTISVLAGNGDGTFKARASYSSGAIGAASMSFGDVDGNGSQDIIVSNIGTALDGTSTSVFLNNGNGTFKAAVTYQTGTGPDASLLRDVKGDGKAELLVTNRGNSNGTTFSVLMGNGDGTFKAQTTFSTGGVAPVDLLGVDANNDGILDLAIVNGVSENLSVILGNGDGTFKAATTSPTTTGGLPFAVGSADLNGDNSADFIVSNFYVASVSLYFGTPQLPAAHVGSVTDARNALASLEFISQSIGKELSNIGAAQSRLMVAARNLATKKEQDTAAYSRIADVDTAQESAAAVALQIRQQIGTSVLAQANQAPALSLALLN